MSERDLRPGWKVWRFDQMAYEVKDRIERPADSGLERYVGLEHLDTGSLKIWRWGSTSDVEKQKLLFKKGDIIFGRRNAYLRRVAVADFDGVCSAHAMVLRAHTEVVLTEFLPFFMQTDCFWEAALKVSAGSMSPTINWSNLASEEFALPPVEEQRRIAGVLQAAVLQVESIETAIAQQAVLLQSGIDSEVGNPKHRRVKIESLVSQGIIAAPQDGNHGEKHPKAADFVEAGIPFLMASDIKKGHVDFGSCKRISKERARSLRIGFALEGDVLLTHKGTVGETAILKGLDTEFAMLTPQVTYYRIADSSALNASFLYFAFRSSSFRNQLAAYSRQSTRAYVGITNQQNLCVPLPNAADQVTIVKYLENIELAGKGLVRRMESAISILRRLISSLLKS